MGMSTGGGKGGGQNDINVTPLIDVLLVLLVIFLVVMPIMMKMETLQVPQDLTEDQQPDPDASMLTLKVASDLSISFTDGIMANPRPIPRSEIQETLRPRLDLLAKEKKVVFVDFDDGVPWKDVVATMDEIRAIAADVNHDDVKVALKIRKPEQQQPGMPQ